ncbi:MAG: hypothetical protein ACQKBV_11605 [Puniceicoccales bacterium]
MKTLLIITSSIAALLFAGCTTDDSSSSAPEQPVNQTGTGPETAPAPTTAPGYQMTPAEERVYKLQALDRQYINGGMTAGDYHAERERIEGLY